MFDPGLKIGQIIKNSDIIEIFKCGNMGGMRRSKKRIRLLSYPIIQKDIISIKGSMEFSTILAWVNQGIKISIGHKMLHWLSPILTELMFIFLRLLMPANIYTVAG